MARTANTPRLLCCRYRSKLTQKVLHIGCPCWQRWYEKRNFKLNNPYNTPSSDLGEDKQSVSKTKWKVFFWVIIVIELLSLILMVSDSEETWLNIILDIIVYSSIIIGLYGFSYNKKILNKKIWVYLIPIGIALEIYGFLREGLTFESSEEMYVVLAITAVIIVPLLFLQFLALYKYSFKSPEIWS